MSVVRLLEAEENGASAGGRAFRKPTTEEVRAYAAEIGLPEAEADAFRDHFESNGWRVSGRTAMKDWRAALRNWKRRQQATAVAPIAVLPATQETWERSPSGMSNAELEACIGRIGALFLMNRARFTPEVGREYARVLRRYPSDVAHRVIDDLVSDGAIPTVGEVAARLYSAYEVMHGTLAPIDQSIPPAPTVREALDGIVAGIERVQGRLNEAQRELVGRIRERYGEMRAVGNIGNLMVLAAWDISVLRRRTVPAQEPLPDRDLLADVAFVLGETQPVIESGSGWVKLCVGHEVYMFEPGTCGRTARRIAGVLVRRHGWRALNLRQEGSTWVCRMCDASGDERTGMGETQALAILRACADDPFR